MRFLQTLWRFLIGIQLLPALEGGEETLVGGQAVLEGVMMRTPHAWGITCRKPSGELTSHSEPVERFSANVQLDEIQKDEAGNPAEKKFELSGWIATINIIFSVGFFIFMYKYLP